MSDPYLGEIKMWAFAWAPSGWALCDGSQHQVNQNQALAALLGNHFGGDGVTTYNLPDLRGRTPVGVGNTSYATGNNGGLEAVVLTSTNVPSHGHTVVGFSEPSQVQPPTGAVLSNVVSATQGSQTNFSTFLPSTQWTADAQLAAGSVSVFGQSQGHENMQPFAVTNFTIATSGNFPPRN